jgi:hypothetical protein
MSETTEIAKCHASYRLPSFPTPMRQDDADRKAAIVLRALSSWQRRASKAARHATSDWMEIEQRGISVASVMQMEYRDLRDQPARHPRPPGFFQRYLR